MGEKIVFTDRSEFLHYNEMLLSAFVTYLNSQHRKNRNVFECGASIQIVSEEELIKGFLETVKDARTSKPIFDRKENELEV